MYDLYTALAIALSHLCLNDHTKDYKRTAKQYPENAALQQLAALAIASYLQQEDFENLCWEDYQQISKFCLGA